MSQALDVASTVAAPIQLFLELTSVCNLRCTHCYVRAGEGRRRQIPADRVCRLIEEFSDLGGAMVSVSGGEPTLYAEWRAVVRHARFYGLNTMLLTNGTMLSDKDISFLRDVGCAVAVSLDGATAETHERIRGAGNFDLVIRALERLLAGGMSDHTTLMFTPMAHNVWDLSGIVSLAHRMRIATVYVSLLEDRGRAHDRISSMAPDRTAFPALIYSVYSLQQRYPDVLIQCLNLKMFTERLRDVHIPTEGLDRTIRVTADSEVYLTAYLDDEPFQLGVYAPGGLRELWESSKVKSALQSSNIRAERGAPVCQSCLAWAWCHGGSSAFAWNATGSFAGEDGFCDAKRRIVGELGLVTPAAWN